MKYDVIQYGRGSANSPHRQKNKLDKGTSSIVNWEKSIKTHRDKGQTRLNCSGSSDSLFYERDCRGSLKERGE